MEKPPYICPVSQLPIINRPEWQRIKFGADFEVSIDLIGDRIILIHAFGPPELEDVKKSMAFVGTLIEKELRSPFIQIFNYSGIKKRVSIEVRRYGVWQLKKRSGLRAAIFYGLNPSLKLSVKLASFFRLLPFTCLVFNHYVEAVTSAVEIIAQDFPQPKMAANHDFLDQETGRILTELEPREETSPEPDPYELALELLEDEISYLDEQEALQRHQETLKRLQRIIDQRNAKARIYQRSLHPHSRPAATRPDPGDSHQPESSNLKTKRKNKDA